MAGKKSAGQKAPAQTAGTQKRTTGKVQGLFVRIRAELAFAERPVWRELTVTRDVTLPELHSILQIVFGWNNSHLFCFEVGKLRYGKDPESGELDYFGVEIGEIAAHAKKMTYRYDFGDDWEVLLQLTLVDEIVSALQGGKKMDPELREWIPEDYARAWEGTRL